MSFPRYPAYKDSGVAWLKCIPAHWAIVQLRHLVDCLDGQRIPLNSAERSDRKGDVPYWGANSVQDYIDAHLFDEELVLLGEDGAPFFDKTKPVAFRSEGRIWPNNHIHVLRPRVKGDSAFLTYCLNATDFADYVDGSTRDKLTQSAMNRIAVTQPSEDERTAIVHFLDRETAKIDALVAEQEQLITLLKEKRQAVISHAVTKGLDSSVPMKDSGVEWIGVIPAHWNVIALKRLVKPESSISYGIVQPGEPLDHGVPFVQTTNMSTGQFDLDNLQKTSAHIAAQYPRSQLVGGEVILGIRASIGSAYVVPIFLAGANLSRGVARIDCREGMLPEYLANYLASNSVDTYWNLAKQGSTFNEVSIETVRELLVTVPPAAEQRRLNLWLKQQTESFDELITEAQAASKLLQERRSALISAAVTGQIDVRGLATAKEAA